MAIRNLLHAKIDVHSRILIAVFPKDGIKCIEKLQSHCANMTFSEKSKYDRTFQQVTNKVGGYAINYIKRFQNAHALSVSVGNSYSEDQLMHTFLDNFHQGGEYAAQIAIPDFFLEMHISFVPCVVMLLHYSTLLPSTLCKILFEKGKYVLNS